MPSYKRFILLLVALLLVTAPVSAQPAPDQPQMFADFIEPDFPFITTTLDADTLGSHYPAFNISVRGLLFPLGNDYYACFDPDLLRMAAIWRGNISLVTMAQISYNEAGNKRNGIPRLSGEPIVLNGMYAGIQEAGQAHADPRPPGYLDDEPGRGPFPPSLGRWEGVRIMNDRAILVYRVGETKIEESVARQGERVVRQFRFSGRESDMEIVVGHFPDYRQADRAERGWKIDHAGVEVVGDVAVSNLQLKDDGHLVLHLPAGSESLAVELHHYLNSPNVERPRSITFPDVTAASSHWPESIETRGILGPDTSAYTVDILPLPLPNPWQRNVRVSGIDFFADGRAALSTFEGDVWIVSGLEGNFERIEWRRYASGLYEPMSLQIVDEEVYTFGRDGIIKLLDENGDGEADFYYNFSSAAIQTQESREFALSMRKAPQGGFYISKGGATSAGPPTSPSIAPGFRKGGPHSGTVVYIDPDGEAHRYATGFRTPYIGVHPETGSVTASDQQGNFVPSTPIYMLQEGGFYGVLPTAHIEPIPEPISPITWVPHAVDRSGTEQVWMIDSKMGPLNGQMIHLSYGQPGVYRVYVQNEGKQGGLIQLPGTFPGPTTKGAVHPLDGQLYMAGFQVWDSSAEEISAFVRYRYTGQPYLQPIDFSFKPAFIQLEFGVQLDAQSTQDPGNYLLRRWNYQRTPQYGSGHFRLDGEPGEEELPVQEIHLLPDQRTIEMYVSRLEPVMQMSLSYDVLTKNGIPLRDAVHFTVNEMQRLPSPRNEETSAVVRLFRDEEPASAERGEVLYEANGCVACHSVDGSDAGRSGPSFKGLYGSIRKLAGGEEVEADDAYLKEAIYAPHEAVVEGYEVEMPSYVGVLSESEVQSLILFIKSMGEE